MGPRQTILRSAVLLLLAGALLTAPTSGAAASACLRGVNLAGGEFGKLPGEYGRTHIFPSTETMDYFAARGANAIRLPFRWERLQPALFGPLNQAEFAHLQKTVARATSRGLTVILDPHNYAEYGPDKIGTGNVTAEAFADFWRRLASAFSGRGDVIYLLMNEPESVTAATWLDATNAAIAAIRTVGADNLIMVPGTIWTGASHWFDNQEGGSNAEVMTNVQDPLNRFIFDVHQYMDKNFSGTNRTCPRVDDAILALEGVTGWLRQHGFTGFLGEFGGTKSPDCMDGLAEMAGYVDSQSDVWAGWAAWAGGEWWGDYPLSLQPSEGIDRPQMTALEPFFNPKDPSGANCATLHTPVRVD
ncbi:MAG: glycoside hydrolase family 5 protein [Roseibium sp.]|nr:glycoside hydrolase family 5 protein [Roseibium sp.]